jgi:hypothetical protein
VSDSAEYHLVTVTEAEAAQVRTFATREELLYVLRQLRRQTPRGRVQVFVFHGVPLGITSPPYPYLLENGFAAEPLFTPPAPGEVDKSGNLFEDENESRPTDYRLATSEAGTDDERLLIEAPDEPLADEED